MKRTIVAVVCGLLVVLLLVGCGPTSGTTGPETEKTTVKSETTVTTVQPEKTQPEASVKKPDTVIDAEGRKVTVPDKVERIVITCRGGTTNQVAIFGAADLIVGQPNQDAFPHLVSMYPRFKDVIDAGSFENTNVEEVLRLEPDIVLAGYSSPKANGKLEEAGLTVYTMQIGWATTETIRDEFLNLGIILDNQEQAKKLVSYWDEKLGLIDDLLKDVPEAERKTVYYIGKTIEKANKGDWGVSWIEGSGGKIVVNNEFEGDVSVEQVLAWDPDVIVTQGGNGTAELVADARIQDLTAIKNGTVYACPIGGFWWDRPSPESPLGFIWLAQKLYPEEMKGVDLKKETFAFFESFYDYKLTDEEYNSFFKD